MPKPVQAELTAGAAGQSKQVRMAQGDGATDAARVAEVLAGDREAFGALVERHSRVIFRLAYRLTGNEQDAEEVVQETFLRAYCRLRQFESRSSFGTWLYRIGVNCSRDLARRRAPGVHSGNHSRPEELEFPSAAPAPDRLLWSAELGRQVFTALDSLSTNERTAFVLRHMEGRSLEEIGAALGLRPGAVKNTIFRAVRKLRQTLGPIVTGKR
jgi:RNA polymerase sigma-70 factor, ECF subfamily